MAIDAPYRAEDAAVVPVSIHSLLPADDGRRIQSITLVIDENPSPLAAKFLLGASSGIRSLSRPCSRGFLHQYPCGRRNG